MSGVPAILRSKRKTGNRNGDQRSKVSESLLTLSEPANPSIHRNGCGLGCCPELFCSFMRLCRRNA